MNKLKKIPEFKNEVEEFEFWSNNNSIEFIDWNKANVVNFPKLKKSTREISLSIPTDLFEKIQVRANKINVSFDDLIKIYLQKAYRDFSKNYSIK